MIRCVYPWQKQKIDFYLTKETQNKQDFISKITHLFLIYINDIPEIAQYAKFILYAERWLARVFLSYLIGQKRPNLVPQKSPFPAKTGSGA